MAPVLRLTLVAVLLPACVPELDEPQRAEEELSSPLDPCPEAVSVPPTRSGGAVTAQAVGSEEPLLLDFGTVEVGSTTEAEILIRSVGVDTLSVGYLTILDAELRWINESTMAQLLAPGSSATAELELEPTRAGAFEGVLFVCSSA